MIKTNTCSNASIRLGQLRTNAEDEVGSVELKRQTIVLSMSSAYATKTVADSLVGKYIVNVDTGVGALMLSYQPQVMGVNAHIGTGEDTVYFDNYPSTPIPSYPAGTQIKVVGDDGTTRVFTLTTATVPGTVKITSICDAMLLNATVYMYCQVKANLDTIVFPGGVVGSWRAVTAPYFQRIIDYKIKASSQNFFYFSSSREWVIYHTLETAGFTGDDFMPWLGLVTCYDENDEEIIPSDILFYPQAMNNGVYESAKVIVKWPKDQSGKASFNQGFSKREDQDQSRIIMDVVAENFQLIDGKYNIDLWPRYSARSSAIVTTEPFMTVDAIGNGEVIKYALTYANDVTDPASDKFMYMGNIRIRANRQFHDRLDRLMHQNKTNPDILYTITLKSKIPSYLISDSSWFGSTQNNLFRHGGDGQYTIDINDLPRGAIDMTMGINVLVVDNVGYYYDAGSDYEFNMVLYCHGKVDGTDTPWSLPGSKTLAQLTIDALDPDSGVGIAIDKGEMWRPMIKPFMCGGYLKLICKSSVYAEVINGDGTIEREYVLEFPCARSVHDIARTVEMNYVRDAIIFKDSNIVFPLSYIREGAIPEDASERIRLESRSMFTKAVFAVSDASVPTRTYTRSSGGGSYDRSLVGSNNIGVIDYAPSSVYQQVIPNAWGSKTGDRFFVEVLSGTGGHDTVNPNFNARVFLFYDNRKWRYNKSEFESFNCGSYPAFVFDVDATALLQQLNTTNLPQTPDLKRWLHAYCRGFGITQQAGQRVAAVNSGSELVFEIWDNKSTITTTFDCTAAVDAGSNIIKNMDFINYNVNAFDADMSGGGDITINGTIFSNITYVDPGHLHTDTVPVADVFGELSYIRMNKIEPNWRSITPSQNDANTDPNASFISEDRVFKFGGDKVVADGGSYKNVDLYLDLLVARNQGFTTTKYNARDRYIDSNNRIRFRARLQPKTATPISKSSTDTDVIVGGNPWTDGVEAVPVQTQEDIKVFGLDYFKTHSL